MAHLWAENGGKRAPLLKKGSCAPKDFKSQGISTFLSLKNQLYTVLIKILKVEREKTVPVAKITKTRRSARGLRTRTVNVDDITFGGCFSSGRNMCYRKNIKE